MGGLKSIGVGREELAQPLEPVRQHALRRCVSSSGQLADAHELETVHHDDNAEPSGIGCMRKDGAEFGKACRTDMQGSAAARRSVDEVRDRDFPHAFELQRLRTFTQLHRQIRKRGSKSRIEAGVVADAALAQRAERREVGSPASGSKAFNRSGVRIAKAIQAHAYQFVLVLLVIAMQNRTGEPGQRFASRIGQPLRMQMEADLLPVISDRAHQVAQRTRSCSRRKQRIHEVGGLEPGFGEHAQLIGNASRLRRLAAIEVPVDLTRQVTVGGQRRMRPLQRIRPDLGIDGDEDFEHSDNNPAHRDCARSSIVHSVLYLPQRPAFRLRACAAQLP